MICSKCGCEGGEAVKFCRRCGAKNEVASPVVPPLEPPPAVRPPSSPPPVLLPLRPSTEPPIRAMVRPVAQPMKTTSPRGKLLMGVVPVLLLLGAGAYWMGSRSAELMDDRGVFATMEVVKAGVFRVGVINELGSTLYTEELTTKTPRGKQPDDPVDNASWEPGKDWGVKLTSGAGTLILIDRFGKKTVSPAGIPTADFVDGLAPAVLSQNPARCGYLDRDHKMKIPAEYDQCGPFSDGLALVHRDAKAGYVNKSGTLQIPLQFSEGCLFAEGLAKTKVGDHWQVINRQCRAIFPVEGEGCVEFSEGLMPALQAKLAGYVDLSGRFVIPGKYASAFPFRDSRAFVKQGETVLLIDRSGKEIGIPKLEGFALFEAGLARVMANGKWGLMDTQGRFVVEPKYKVIEPLMSGLRAAVEGETSVSYLDERGAEVKAPRPLCANFRHGVFTCVTALGHLAFLTGQSKLEYFTRSGTRIGGISLSGL